MSDSTRLFLTLSKLMHREAFLFQILGLPQIELVGESSTGIETLRNIEILAPDILIIEEDLQDNDGLSIAEVALSKHPSLFVILLVDTSISQQRLSIYLEAGIKSVIALSQPFSQLVKAIDYVSQGQFYVDASNFSAVQKTEPLRSDAFYSLSDREQEVAKLIANRIAFKRIAEELGLSHKTVHTYKERILSKLGFVSVTELVIFMRRFHNQLLNMAV